MLVMVNVKGDGARWARRLGRKCARAGVVLFDGLRAISPALVAENGGLGGEPQRALPSLAAGKGTNTLPPITRSRPITSGRITA